MSTPFHFALVGFANSGKSSLFNRLTGGRQQVSNWSGATVSVKQARFTLNKFEDDNAMLLSDLPGISSLTAREDQGQDLTISREFISHNSIDCIINIVDVTQLKRQLFLTLQLLELGIPVVVLLNKNDRAEARDVDVDLLSSELKCPVFSVSAHKTEESAFKTKLESVYNSLTTDNELTSQLSADESHTSEQVEVQYQKISKIVQRVQKPKSLRATSSDVLDSIVLHPLLGVPIFLGVMYLLFMFAINVGGAFIDFFDVLAGAVFVSYPMHYLADFNLPLWLLTIIEGIGSGVQTVATFIPIIACLFIGLSLLESSGYLARAAFVVDSLMQKIGLPGKAFVPLIVGFGCTVPAVMATRVLDSERERITTVMMAPFMSCGARLPVYALFAAAFFPENGQNLVFLLYLIGILAAIFTGFLLKKTTLPGNSSVNIMELPLFERPKLSFIMKRVWQRTSGFVTGAGKTIVIVVCLINFTNSIGTDGSFGNQDSEKSVLSYSAKIVMPVLAPLGVKEENWQAGVGIITGIFAKEVLVATFNSLYSPDEAEGTTAPSLVDSWHEAVGSINENLLGISPDDPLGMSVGEVSDLTVAAEEQEVALTTYQVMQRAFDGQLGAFSYLLFILLYTPCVAAMGAIKNEVGTRWAIFAGTWSLVLAYQVSILSYQIGNIAATPVISATWISGVLISLYAVYLWLKHKSKQVLTIPIRVQYH
jgi:ferrous iron transport protein B